MLVYRVESADGRGAYREGILAHEFDALRQPMPAADGSLAQVWTHLWFTNKHRSYFFGFDSVDALLAWFYDAQWRQQADKDGLFVGVYDINPDEMGGDCRTVYRGDKQLVFRRDLARRVDTLSLATLRSVHLQAAA